METIYDWVTVALFGGLIVLFLERSMNQGAPRDHIWQYLLASVGFMGTNYFGNEGQHIVAILILALTVGFIFYAIKPFDRAS